ncbi:MAG: C cytochrome precursor [Planctomycetota bacterium]|nr:MAG: C cytochrome precursor [Planctomycetota bacterium]REK48122.1 MAG: C cytochrome precursor [Planctomycetota bacterium]
MFELAVAALLFTVALLLLAWRYSGRATTALLVGVVGLAVVATLAWVWRDEPQPPPIVNRPIEVLDEGYVSSQACRACHLDNYETWYASYHRTMTQVAHPDIVAGDFDEAQLTDEVGRTFRLTSTDDALHVEIRDPHADGPVARHPVVMTTGSHHYQAYWYASGQGRELGMLPFIHLIDQQQYDTPRWILRRAAFLRPPASPHGEVKPLEIGRWNRVCYMCHSTRGQPRIYQPQPADTHAVEFGISCEACHGPGAAHVAENSSPRQTHAAHQREMADESVVNPEGLDHVRSSQVCGQCHSVITPVRGEQWDRWHTVGFEYRPGDDLAATRTIDPSRFVLNEENLKKLEGLAANPEALLAHTFWPDGMVRVSGREFSGLVATPCYQRGTMSCLSCHEMHPDADDPRPLDEWADDQLKQGMRSNEACYQCHEPMREQLVEHTHHQADSSGSNCYNCHMPHTSYGLLKAIRSHQIDSPDVAHSVAPTGRPNACNQCHLDKSLGWTADHLQSWYGVEPPPLSDDERRISATLLWLLRGDAAQRSLAAWTMGWQPAQKISGTEWMTPFLAQLLDDPYDSTRFIVERTLRRLPDSAGEGVDFMAPRPVRQHQAGRLIDAWNRQYRDGVRHGEESLLIDARGQIDIQAAGRLLRHRDNRRMYLNE